MSLDVPRVPIQVLDALLLPLLSPTAKLHQVITNSKLPPIFQVTESTFLPQINASLPCLWYTNVLDSTTAVKNDDAAVNVDIWNQRIQLVFPHVTTQVSNMSGTHRLLKGTLANARGS